MVGVSSIGGGKPQTQHAGLITASLAMDDLIADTGVNYRALRMPSFMDNLLRQKEASKQGAFYSPVPGDLQTATCSTRAMLLPPQRNFSSIVPGAERASTQCPVQTTCPRMKWHRSSPKS